MLGEGVPAADLQAARHAYGLDLPLSQQYLNYWKGVLHGNLGLSLRYNQSVSKLLVQRYPYTLKAHARGFAGGGAALDPGGRAFGAPPQ